MTDPTPDKWARNARGQFGPNNAGGPGGAGRRSAYRQAIQDAISPEHAACVARQMVAQALKGNVPAANLMFAQLGGRPAKAPTEPEVVPLDLPAMNTTEGCGTAAEMVVAGVANGKINTKTAKTLLDGVKTRLDALQAAQNERGQPVPPPPIPANMIRSWFVRFTKTGQLPDDRREAFAVVEKVKAGYVVVDPSASTSAWFDGFTKRHRAESPVMDAILNEAALGIGIVRQSARSMLRLIVRVGWDVTAAHFTNTELPEYGGVALHMFGYPQMLARRPYVAQARRLFKRVDAARRSRPKDPQALRDFQGRMDDAIVCFQMTGELPKDPVILDQVLIVGELATLTDYMTGEKVGDVLKLFDIAATTTGPERERAILQLQGLAKAGRFWGGQCTPPANEEQPAESGAPEP
jgi:hypothetical protein